MKNYFYHAKLLLYRFLLLVSFFTLSRLLFYFFNISYFQNINFPELIKILFFGIRFDISALYYFNLLIILLHLIPLKVKKHKVYQTILFIMFMLINSILLSTNIIDTKFFDFEHKRLTSEIFSSVWIGEDFRTLLPEFIKDYWYLIMIWIFMILGLFKFYPKFKPDKEVKERFTFPVFIYQLIFFILLMGFGLILGRGGFQMKPLRVIHAAQYTSAKNIPLILNTPFTIMKTIGFSPMKTKKYFEKNVLDSIYSPVLQYTQRYNQKSKPNIVLIILESFSSEYVGILNQGKGYTPFLDSLSKQGLFFTKAFANGKRSIEAMPSIISGLPALTDESYITSRYSTNKINSVASILKSQGYYSAFFHGGKNGTMGFDQFAHISGFDNYFGMDEYPDENDYDGNWGIYDEEYLLYFGKSLSDFKEPFFASVFTLTSHHPYEIPKKYKGKFPKGTLNIHESIGYTDYSLKHFFDSVKESNWYKNTLFILVADHTAQAESPYYNNKLGNYAIPILFYHPTDISFKGINNKIAQQIDILPTIADYTDYNQSFICYGNSLTDSCEHFTINYMNGIYQYVDSKHLLQFDGEKTTGFFNIKNDSLLKNNLIKNTDNYIVIENKLKAIIQSYQERMVKNQFTTD